VPHIETTDFDEFPVDGLRTNSLPITPFVK
jgi:hypothetical protein